MRCAPGVVGSIATAGTSTSWRSRRRPRTEYKNGTECSLGVAIVVWYLNLAEAVGAPVHGHQALRGTGEWELLVEVPHLSLPCGRICFFGPDVAVGLPFGYLNEWS